MNKTQPSRGKCRSGSTYMYQWLRMGSHLEILYMTRAHVARAGTQSSHTMHHIRVHGAPHATRNLPDHHSYVGELVAWVPKWGSCMLILIHILDMVVIIAGGCSRASSGSHPLRTAGANELKMLRNAAARQLSLDMCAVWFNYAVAGWTASFCPSVTHAC